MDQRLIELARRIFGQSGHLVDQRDAIAQLPASDREAVLAFGNRLALSGTGAGSLPLHRGVETWE